MRVPMVNVRIVGMRMHQPIMPVRMRMRLAATFTRRMRVLMMRIMKVAVLMLHGVMPMLMLMPLG